MQFRRVAYLAAIPFKTPDTSQRPTTHSIERQVGVPAELRPPSAGQEGSRIQPGGRCRRPARRIQISGLRARTRQCGRWGSWTAGRRQHISGRAAAWNGSPPPVCYYKSVMSHNCSDNQQTFSRVADFATRRTPTTCPNCRTVEHLHVQTGRVKTSSGEN